MSETLIQSYVWHGDKCFFVSTINRDSSAAAMYGQQYAETMVWDYDYETKERGEIVSQCDDLKDSIYAHLRIVKLLRDTGRVEVEETT